MSPPKKVLLLCEFPTLHGGERSQLSIVPRLSTLGFQFVACAPDDGALTVALHDLAVPVSPFDREVTLELRRRCVRDAIEQRQPDLVHANGLNIGRVAGPVAAEMGVPLVTHLRDIVGLSRQAVTDLNQSTRLVAVSEATRAAHVAQGLRHDRVVVIRNGVDLERFHPARETAAWRAGLGIAPGDLVIGAVGQIIRRKGFDTLASAAAALEAKRQKLGTSGSLHWVIVGERHSRKEEAIEFDRQLRDDFHRAVGPRAHFLGTRADVDELLRGFDLFVHPSRQEPLGRVLLEAAATVLPIVATDVGGTREIFPAGEAAFTPANDPQALGAAIEKLIASRELRAALGAAARRRVETAFTLEQAAVATARVYDECLESGHGG